MLQSSMFIGTKTVSASELGYDITTNVTTEADIMMAQAWMYLSQNDVMKIYISPGNDKIVGVNQYGCKSIYRVGIHTEVGQ